MDQSTSDQLIARSMMTPKTPSQRRRKDETKQRAKTVENDPKAVQNDLKITRNRCENCMFLDGRMALDRFEIFGLICNLILYFST